MAQEKTERINAKHPLFGMTILAVEDSLYASEALRLLCLHSGARFRRADCLTSARRHLRVYRPTVLIVDLGLPDGAGHDLVREMSKAVPRIDVILGLSGMDGSAASVLAAGADGFLAKPVNQLAEFQQVILQHLPESWQAQCPRPLADMVVTPDMASFVDDMQLVSGLMDDARDGDAMGYIAQFLAGVARSAGDRQLAAAARDLEAAPTLSCRARICGLIQERMQERMAL